MKDQEAPSLEEEQPAATNKKHEQTIVEQSIVEQAPVYPGEYTSLEAEPLPETQTVTGIAIPAETQETIEVAATASPVPSPAPASEAIQQPVYSDRRRREIIDPPQPPRRTLAIMFALLLLLALIIGTVSANVISHLTSASDTSTQNITFPSIKHPKLLINSENGAIHVHSRPTGPITVQATKFISGTGSSLQELYVGYTQAGNTVTFSSSMARNLFFFGARGIDLDITVPYSLDIEIHANAGAIEIDGVKGQVAAEINSGSIIAHNIVGQVDLQVGTGGIDASNVQGQVTFVTQNGTINARGSSFNGTSLLKANGGSLAFSGTLDRRGSYRFTTSNGPIDVTLPASSVFHLLIATGSGHVTNDFKSNNIGKGPRALLTLETGSDPILVHKG